ncbi:MAG: acyltransferase [Flavisolibacter sp.]|jgi:peptidoglycan/LPS O-acetylase OafA/YrhL|nr:acyltransferase [Flavisolibacter sp.]
MFPATTDQRVYYPALDVLRGLAICFVVFYHNFESVSFFRFGWMGVDLFFVLSGYLITDLLLKTRENKFFFRNFYIRRVLRIFPLYYLVLIAFFTLAPLIFSQQGPNTTFSYYTENKAWFLMYFQNWLLVEKGPPPMPFLAHFWSLAVEEQFYMFWPVLVFFVKKLSNLRTLILLLIVFSVITRVFTWVQFPNEVESFYCSTLTRMDSLLMGSLLAVHLKQGKTISAAWINGAIISFMLLIGCSLFIYGNVRQDNALFPTIGYTVSAIFFASLLFLLLKNEAKLLGWIRHLKALSFIGKISYGIYVFHIPIYLVLSTQLTRLFAEKMPPSFDFALFVSILSVLITVAASTMSFYLIEKPILSLKKHFP